MDELERRLTLAGERWRAGQPPATHLRLVVRSRPHDGRLWPVGLFAALATVAVALVVVLLAAQALRPPAVGTSPSAGPSDVTSPVVAAPAASSSPSLVYPDGLPMQIANEHVYRAGDPVAISGGGEVLVTGWVVGWIVPSCGLRLSPQPGSCPSWVELADSPGGPTALVVTWPPSPVGAAVVVRIKPANQGCGATSLSCIAPTVEGVEVVWVGPPNRSAGVALALVAQVGAGQPRGTIAAAGYIETTFASFAASLPDRAGLPAGTSSADIVEVVEVDGWFPAAHRGPLGADTDATSIVIAYDETLLMRLDEAYVRDPSITGPSAGPGLTLDTFRYLTRFGVPVALNVP
jgi:hypothetical protein